MNMLAQNPKVLFIGQTVKYPGSVISDTVEGVSENQKWEMPVAEELQMGMSIGLALQGYIPVTIFPRIDFLLLAMNQLSNHLDVLDELTHGEFHAKMIIRTIIGARTPLYPGIQHCRDLTVTFQKLLWNIPVAKITEAEQVMPTYERALKAEYSSLIIEMAELY